MDDQCRCNQPVNPSVSEQKEIKTETTQAPVCKRPPMRQHFKDVAVRLAEKDPRLVLIFGDISVYLFRDFWSRWPDRFFNVGICENTLVSMTAGLSAVGFHPFVHTIAPFITDRSYEQIKLDLCYNRFGGNIVSCGATFDYAWDGATHHAYADLAMLRLLPGMEVMQPGSNEELETLIGHCYANGNPSYYRISHDEHGETLPCEFGRGVVVRDQGAKVTIVTAGPILGNVLQACADLPVNVLYFHTLKPFDHELLARYRQTRILVVHDAHGLHEAVTEVPDLRVALHGLPDQFCCYYGTLNDARREVRLDAAGIREAVKRRLAEAKQGD